MIVEEIKIKSLTKMKKINITYILSDIQKAIAFEWIAEHIDKSRFDLSFILLNPNDSPLERFLLEHTIPVYRVRYEGKKSIPKAFFKVRQLLKKLKTEVVHCHLFAACVVGLTAARSLGIKKRIHTRHHSTFHHEYFPKAVFYDKMINRLSSDIVAISHNVQEILTQKEKVKDKKIHLIHHGFDLEEFTKIDTNLINTLKKKYDLVGFEPVIGVVARQVHWKGIQFIIPAFEQLLEQYPNAKLVLTNANGDFKTDIQALLKNIPTKNYIEIEFEENVTSLFHLFDVYVHTPINAEVEAFGQTYIEALASGIPSVFTLSGVAHELIENEKNALVVDYQNSVAILEAIKRILEDKNLANTLKMNGIANVQHSFHLQTYIQKLEKLYTL